ncbi:MAG: acetyl-CoA carboxylase biotin carboxyl carrier protein [Firmicutes bacterium]|nr:acetyl-CoA carboxylase biotin carboxyl carrier protein [Bacillota bacterium]
MNVQTIKELIEIVSQSDIAELVVEDDDKKLVIKRPSAFIGQGQAVVSANLIPPANPVEVGQPQQAPADEPGSTETELVAANQITVNAPMVGTFYVAPAPDAEPYVKVGDRVQVGQPLCIIEAMKLMNEIEAEVSGKIVKVLVSNAQPVEYGQPLFVIEQD